jgi:ATP-dependent phosphoenolpyruvate carboxykinase
MFFVVSQVWPWFKDQVYPSRVNKHKQDEQVAILDRERLSKLEERQVAAFERVAGAVESLSQNTIVINERVAHLTMMSDTHITETSQAITEMRERTAYMRNEIPAQTKPRGKKIPE